MCVIIYLMGMVKVCTMYMMTFLVLMLHIGEHPIKSFRRKVLCLVYAAYLHRLS
jgi:hypothetical protein